MPVPYEERSDSEKLRAAERRQEIIARFGHRALQDADLQDLLQEAAGLAAEGMDTKRAKVLEYRPATDDLLVRAGVGWKDGVVGHATLPSDLASPPGYVFRKGEPLALTGAPRTAHHPIAPRPSSA